MNTTDREILWQQFAATIDMFGTALRDCPGELWSKNMWPDPSIPGSTEFWYVAYHTLFWLDLYLTGAVEGFSPPAPYNLDELDPAGVLPPRTYTHEELAGYLAYCRQKSQEVILGLTDEQAYRLCRFPWGELPFAGLLLDNLRHVQEHGAQLRMFLGQQAGTQARWLAKA